MAGAAFASRVTGEIVDAFLGENFVDLTWPVLSAACHALAPSQRRIKLKAAREAEKTICQVLDRPVRDLIRNHLASSGICRTPFWQLSTAWEKMLLSAKTADDQTKLALVQCALIYAIAITIYGYELDAAIGIPGMPSVQWKRMNADARIILAEALAVLDALKTDEAHFLNFLKTLTTVDLRSPLALLIHLSAHRIRHVSALISPAIAA